MASIVKHTDKRSGITYAYESISYWDKEKKQPRNKRRLIGRVDPTTGEIVPTDGRCKNRSPYHKTEETVEDQIMAEIKGMKVGELRKEIVRLRMELEDARQQLKGICEGK